MNSVGIVVGLGLAGVDPFGLAIVVSAIARGAKIGAVLGFTVSMIICTVALGTALSLAGDLLADQVLNLFPVASDPRWAFVEIIVAAVIF